MTPLTGDAPPPASSPPAPELAIKKFLNRLTQPCRLLVAFSGGGDSTGLLAALAATCADRTDISLHSATVDHGLRSGSAEEARAAGEQSRTLGIPHSVLEWTGAKPTSGVQAAAREARYRLLAEEAARVKADLIVTGHNLDDQEETIFMRGLRGSEPAAGMDEAVLVRRRIWVARPFLTVRRTAIRDYLRQRGLTWVDDPSNDNAAFERIRVRQSGRAEGVAGAATVETDRLAAASKFVTDSVRILSGPVGLVDLTFYCHRDVGHWTAIGTLAAILGGRVHGPDSDVASAMSERLRSGENFRTTANRVVFDRRGMLLYLCREDRGLPDVAIEPGKTACWDGRYEIVNHGVGPVEIGAGRKHRGSPALMQEALPEGLPNDLAKRLEASMPRILGGEGSSIRVSPLLAPFESFLPARKAALANSFANVFKLERFPVLTVSNDAF